MNTIQQIIGKQLLKKFQRYESISVEIFRDKNSLVSSTRLFADGEILNNVKDVKVDIGVDKEFNELSFTCIILSFEEITTVAYEFRIHWYGHGAVWVENV